MTMGIATPPAALKADTSVQAIPTDTTLPAENKLGKVNDAVLGVLMAGHVLFVGATLSMSGLLMEGEKAKYPSPAVPVVPEKSAVPVQAMVGAELPDGCFAPLAAGQNASYTEQALCTSCWRAWLGIALLRLVTILIS